MSKSGFTIGTVLIFLLSSAAVSWAQYSGGSGTEVEPYKIGKVADWQDLIDTPPDWDKHFVLTDDLDLQGVALSPIGNDSNNFTGVFDGNEHIIRNAEVNMPGTNYVGLFGYVDPNGRIRDLGVENVAIAGRYDVGGLVGENYGGLEACYVGGSVSGSSGVGGLVGWNERDGSLTDCYATADVSGYRYGYLDTGGLVGRNYGSLTACYATGSVKGIFNVGGLVGANYGSLEACYATGLVRGAERMTGGLVGANHDTIDNCYATGSVSAEFEVGNLVGYNWAGSINACYAVGNVSGRHGCEYSVGGLVGATHNVPITACFWDIETVGCIQISAGEPKTTAEMQDPNTFISAGWDFVGETANGTEDIWSICEGTNYPRFVWQIPAADWLCPDGVGLEDFSYLGGEWQIPDNSGSPANLDGDEDVGFGDVKMFCELWLAGR